MMMYVDHDDDDDANMSKQLNNTLSVLLIFTRMPPLLLHNGIAESLEISGIYKEEYVEI
jgi:hypothetical protein